MGDDISRKILERLDELSTFSRETTQHFDSLTAEVRNLRGETNERFDRADGFFQILAQHLESNGRAIEIP